MATKTRTMPSPTQALRDLIEGTKWGRADADMMHNALLELERTLNLPLTEPEED